MKRQVQTRSISAENPTGAKGQGAMADPAQQEGHSWSCARKLGKGWKVAPCISLEAGKTVLLGEIQGPGRITHIWCATEQHKMRHARLRIYWDGMDQPSIHSPLGDVFCNAWASSPNLQSLAVSVAPKGGHNLWIPMPFRKSARIELENTGQDSLNIYYQIDYEREEIHPDEMYLHCQFQLSAPLKPLANHTILNEVVGRGHFLGTYVAWQVTNPGWWGEGEMKFFIDGDGAHPTICTTGTEDYFGGAWNFEHPKGRYGEFSHPYQGFHDVSAGKKIYKRYQKFGLYRFHLTDPITFHENFRATIQSLGWDNSIQPRVYLHQRDYISSLSWWYQETPQASLLPWTPEELNTPNVYGPMKKKFMKGLL